MCSFSFQKLVFGYSLITIMGIGELMIMFKPKVLCILVRGSELLSNYLNKLKLGQLSSSSQTVVILQITNTTF